MKRIFCVLVAVCLCVCLTACGEKTPKEINEQTIKVVLVCAGDVDEKTSQAAAYAAQLQDACEMVEITDAQYAVCDGISATNAALAEDAVRKYIKDGYSVVFGTEPGYAEATKKLAAEYPRVTFIQVGAADETLSNFYAYRLKSYEGAYLCGIAAGCSAQKDVFGMIAPSLQTAETHQLANAFLLGARVMKPKATLFVMEASTKDAHISARTTLQNQGCAAILVTTDDTETVVQLHEGGTRVYTVFGNPDIATVAYRVTSSARNQLGDTLQAILSKTTPYYNNMSVGCADGFLVSQPGQGFDIDIQATTMTEKAQKMFRKGEWDVFSGVCLAWDDTVSAFAQSPVACKDGEGTVRILAGAGMPSGELLDSMNWWLEGVTAIQ